MTLKYDFNNPDILRGHLYQALPQIGLQPTKIVVGKEGGLAYLLFDSDDFHNIPRESNIASVDAIKNISRYIDAVDNYINSAIEEASKFNFCLVSARDGKISPSVGINLHFFAAGIGDTSIGSIEKLERFLEMIKTGRGNWGQRYSAVKEAIKALK